MSTFSLKTSDIRRFLASNGHTSMDTEFAGWIYLHEGKIHVLDAIAGGLEDREVWTEKTVRSEFDPACMDDILHIAQWVKENPEKVPDRVEGAASCVQSIPLDGTTTLHPVWRSTPELRFRIGNREYRNGEPIPREKILQQRWPSTSGCEDWRDVPTIN